ncbi:hypothetical protein PQX77_016943 [Marasmius sp. AFHP31]|nr:hypothetical protein PQX77_016943 [Marasmius sp. AFHP31]
MQFRVTLVALIGASVAVQATSTANLERRITDPGNPANLINCPPGGGADACNLEVPVNTASELITEAASKVISSGIVLRLVGGLDMPSYNCLRYNYDINNIPRGIQVGTEQSCTDF